MSRARDFADLAGSADAGGLTGRNLIINGAMQVAQRGTSQTASSYGSLDRFLYNHSGGAGTMSQQTLALGSEQRGSKHFLRIACSTGNDNHGFLHRIEDVRSVSTGKHTLSFDAKGTNPNGGTFTIKVHQDFGTGGSPSADVELAIQTFTVTSSFQTFDFQFDIPSVAGKTLGSNDDDYVQIHISQGADTSTNAWTLDITNIQFEKGETATPFEHRSFGDELAKCQRYYQEVHFKHRYGSSAQAPTGSIHRQASFPTTMRAAPTVDSTGVLTGGAVTINSVTGYTSSMVIEATATGQYNRWVDGTFKAETEL